MKWVRFQNQGRVRFGLLEDDRIFPVEVTWEGILQGVRPAAERDSLHRSEVRLMCPIPRPGKVVAIGQNYWDHCREQNVDPPKAPIIFAKFPTSVIGPGDRIVWSPQLTQQVDFEAELAVVMGRPARHIDPEEALDHVLGYTVANDVSARDLQFGDRQWVRGKSLDSFCPLGPVLVTREEIPDPMGLRIGSRLNDVVMQDSSTKEMIFDIPLLISYCSRAFTLEPGDVILTGTPDGVGVFRKPPVFMKDGDRISVEVEGIGILENTCHTEGIE